MPADPGVEVRALAAQVVFDVSHRGVSLDAALAAHSRSETGKDHALFRELSYGSLRWYWRSRGILDQLIRRPLRKADRLVDAVMVVGLYQLAHMRLPAHAAIHSSVESCVLLGHPGLKGLVNGVLRNFQRRGPALVEALTPSAREAHPEWLWRAVVEQWPDSSSSIFEANNNRPPMTLRVNTRLISRQQYLQRLESAAMEARSAEHLPAAVILNQPVNVERLPGFDDGLVSVQDASAQLLPLLVSPTPGQRVLDACAAPGGKLTHMLEVFPEVAFHALEMDAERTGRITGNLQRLGLQADVVTADAAEPEQWWDGRPFDVVVLDAPCSGSGVIRRHPDIKLLRRDSDIDGYAAAQAGLLDGLWSTLAPGGRLVYATCSILARENQGQVAAFAARRPDCRQVPIELPSGFSCGGGWQVLPGDSDGDGFFYALLEKTA